VDEADIATEQDRIFREALIHSHINRLKGDVLVIDDKYFCLDCGEEIEERRVKVLGACSRCITCQESYEESGRAKIY
jgi:phage/conjugal plasmid C-4 type zinc finger TraR family protein